MSLKNKTNINILTGIATGLSLIGGFLVSGASNDVRLVGFTIWVISNVIWSSYFLYTKQYNPAFMFIVYFITSCIGVYNNL